MVCMNLHLLHIVQFIISVLLSLISSCTCSSVSTSPFKQESKYPFATFAQPATLGSLNCSQASLGHLTLDEASGQDADVG